MRLGISESSSYRSSSNMNTNRTAAVLVSALLLAAFPTFYAVEAIVASPLPAITAPVRFAQVYSDSMVLQRAPERASIWGYSSPGTTIKAALNGAEVATAVANASGVWIALLPAQSASKPLDSHTIVVTDGVTNASITDVLFGDVWVCSGQSNVRREN